MSTSFLKGGDLSLDISRSGALDLDQISIGYVVYKQDDSVERGRISGMDLSWEGGDEKFLKYEIAHWQKIVDGAKSAKIFLSYNDIIYDELLIENQEVQINTLAAVYRGYDPSNTLLAQHLAGKGKDPGRDFEAAVYQLFALCGFSSLHLGSIPGVRDRDSVDVIASTKSGKLLVIECTLKDLNNESKLSKLDGRYKHIASILETAKIPSAHVRPVIVTAYTHAQVEADLEQAGRLGISVVSKDDIDKILKTLEREISAEKLFDAVARLVPSVRYAEPYLSEIMGIRNDVIDI
jgi:hypothetical protein